jgi:hypothetical protein
METQWFRETLLLRYPALLMAPVHLHLPRLQAGRRNIDRNRPHIIIRRYIIHSLPHRHMSWSINIIIVIIQGLCVTTDHIHPGFIAPQP